MASLKSSRQEKISFHAETSHCNRRRQEIRSEEGVFFSSGACFFIIPKQAPKGGERNTDQEGSLGSPSHLRPRGGQLTSDPQLFTSDPQLLHARNSKQDIAGSFLSQILRDAPWERREWESVVGKKKKKDSLFPKRTERRPRSSHVRMMLPATGLTTMTKNKPTMPGPKWRSTWVARWEEGQLFLPSKATDPDVYTLVTPFSWAKALV